MFWNKKGMAGVVKRQILQLDKTIMPSAIKIMRNLDYGETRKDLFTIGQMFLQGLLMKYPLKYLESVHRPALNEAIKLKKIYMRVNKKNGCEFPPITDPPGCDDTEGKDR